MRTEHEWIGTQQGGLVKPFQSKLRRLREARGLSQEALAHRAQLTLGGYRKIEVGANPNGPFHLATAVQPLNGTTTFKLAKGTKGRFVVVWVTALPPAGEARFPYFFRPLLPKPTRSRICSRPPESI